MTPVSTHYLQHSSHFLPHAAFCRLSFGMLLVDVRTSSSWRMRLEAIMLVLAGEFFGRSFRRVLRKVFLIDYCILNRLISASVQSVVFYGFNCQTTELRLYTALCMLTGLAGSIVPFMSWFDERRNKVCSLFNRFLFGVPFPPWSAYGDPVKCISNLRYPLISCDLGIRQTDACAQLIVTNRNGASCSSLACALRLYFP
jgi:hypothetical protein